MTPQTNYKGVESSINTKSTLAMNLNDDKVIPERSEKLQYQIGTNNYNTNKSAEITSVFLLGEISGSVVTQYTGSNIAPIDIPQIECDVEYVLSVENSNKPKVNQYGRIPEEFAFADIKSDGSYIHIEKGEILILLSEEGGFAEKENFSIEVFEFTEDNELNPLKFKKQNSNIIDGIYYDDSELPSRLEEQDLLIEDKVEYHMELLVDDEISHDKICLGTKILKQNNIYVDLEVDCDDLETGFEVDLYQTTVVEEDLEDC